MSIHAIVLCINFAITVAHIRSRAPLSQSEPSIASAEAERVTFNVECEREQKLEECATTALYYTTCSNPLKLYCYDKSKKRAHETRHWLRPHIRARTSSIVTTAECLCVSLLKKPLKQPHLSDYDL